VEMGLVGRGRCAVVASGSVRKSIPNVRPLEEDD